MKSLKDWVREAYVDMGKNDFLKKYPYCFLAYHIIQKTQISKFNKFNTSVMPTYDKNMSRGMKTLIAMPIRKTRSLYANMVTIGRTEASDIPIKNHNVSKFHAYFSKDEDHFYLVDSGSTNGTWVNGNKLDAHKKTPIQNGDFLMFSKAIESWFYNTEGFYTYLGTMKNFI